MGDTRRPLGRLARRFALALAATVGGQSALAAQRTLSGEAGIGFDDNVANVKQGGAERDDLFVQLGATAQTAWRLTPSSAMLWRFQLDAQRFFEHEGLSHADPALRWDWLYRPGADFHAPTLGIAATVLWSEFDSGLRDAAEYRAAVFAQQQLTTRIGWRLGWSASWREAQDQDVFDGGARSATLDLDWQLSRRFALYLGYQYRDGDLISTAPAPAPAVLSAARAFAADDVFPGETAFRLSSRAQVGTAGVNYSVSPRFAVDVQTRYIEAEADIGSHYRRVQALASLLWRY